MLLHYLTPATLKVIYADLKDQADTLREGLKQNRTPADFNEWRRIGDCILEVERQYEALTGEEIAN